MFKLDVEKDGEQVIVKPIGRIDLVNAKRFKDTVLKANRDGFKDVIIDFSEVENIDSAGIGKLLLIHKKLSEQGGKLRLIKVDNDYIKEMFTMIKLDQIIEID